MNMKQLQYFIAAALLFGLSFAAAVYFPLHAELPKKGHVPDFRFAASTGEEVTRADLLGKISVISFFFTSCQGPCPLMNAELLKLKRNLSAYTAFQLLSISVDPEHDTAGVLEQYQAKLGANAGSPRKETTENRTWKFLRAEMPLVRTFAEKGLGLGVGPAESPADQPFHSIKLTLVDSQGEIRGMYNADEAESLRKLRSDAERLLKAL
jgi:protein SCO1/2